MYDDDIEPGTPRDKRHKLTDMLPELPEMTARPRHALQEALYTLDQSSDLSLSFDDALLVWMVVEWARKATAEQIEEIRL